MILSEQEILNVNKKDYMGLTGVFKAIEKQDRLKVDNYLKLENINLNIKTKEGEPLLFFAFRQRVAIMNNKKWGTEIIEQLLNDTRVNKEIRFKNNSILNLLACHYNDVKKFKQYEYLYDMSINEANQLLRSSIENGNYNIAHYLINKKNLFKLDYESLFLEGSLNKLIIKYKKPGKKSEMLDQNLINNFFSFNNKTEFSEMFSNLLNDCVKNDSAELLNKIYNSHPFDINYTLSNKALYQSVFTHKAYKVLMLFFDKKPVIEYYTGEDNIYLLCANVFGNTDNVHMNRFYSYTFNEKNLYDFVKLLNKKIMQFTPEVYELYLSQGIDNNFCLNDLYALNNFSINCKFFSRKEKKSKHLFYKLNDYNQYKMNKLIMWLEDEGYDFTQKDENGNTLLHVLVNHWEYDFVVKLFEKFNLNNRDIINHKNNKGDTFLHNVAKKQYIELKKIQDIIDFAAKNDFNFNDRNNEGKLCYLIETPNINSFNEIYLFYMKQVIEKSILNKTTGYKEKNLIIKRI